MSDTNKREGAGVPRSDEDNALAEFGKKSFIESVHIINEHIKMMIPLTTALITVYFALLEFLGVKVATDAAKIGGLQLIVPPLLLLGSLLVLIAMSFPIPRRIALNNTTNLKSYRNLLVRWRYGGASIGMGLFLLGVLAMIIVMIQIIEVG